MPALLATAWGLLGLVLRCASIAGYCLVSFGTRAAVCQHCWLLLGAVVTKDAVCQHRWLLLGAVVAKDAVCQHCWLLLGAVGTRYTIIVG